MCLAGWFFFLYPKYVVKRLAYNNIVAGGGGGGGGNDAAVIGKHKLTKDIS